MIIKPGDDKLKQILKRGEYFEEEYLQRVLDIIHEVRTKGDGALLKYTKMFDNPDACAANLRVTEEDMERAYARVNKKLIKAMEGAAERIFKYHEKQVEKSWFYENEGILLGQKVTPIGKVGVYVPGGKAFYPSSVLMNALPAKVAGVKEIVMVSPCQKGKTDDVVLAAAKIAGIDKLYSIGGAQAIAALAYGTLTIPKVDKIVGPGNIYVALAKKMVFGVVDIDMIAGPSEILIIADESANPAWIAADMLSQAEHDELASAVTIVNSEKLAQEIEKELYKQLLELPRKDIAEKSLKDFSAIILAGNLKEACEISNDIAPEHLELCVSSPLELMRDIHNAGAIFLGHYTPEACGDYYAGPSHVLPTGGSAKFFSPLGVYDFIKRSSVIYYNEEKLREHCGDIATLANSEGLTAHMNSAEIRFK